LFILYIKKRENTYQLPLQNNPLLFIQKNFELAINYNLLSLLVLFNNMFINGLYLLLYYRTLLMEAKLHLMPTLSYTHRIKDRCSTNTLTHSKSYQNMHIMQNALYKSSKKKSTINKFTELQNSTPLNVQ